MTRTTSRIGFLALLVTVTAMLSAGAAPASAGGLAGQLRQAKAELRQAKAQLHKAEDALAAALAAHQKRGLGALIRRVEKSRRAVRLWTRTVKDLAARLAKARAAASGDWKTLCRRAAAKYGISADGLYRLMMMESGGRARAVGAGRYHGLFQYTLATWRDGWNPWRGRSVYNGAAQIQASAYAIKKGMGYSLWGNTYPLAF